jgi:hypothetical protein
VPASLSKNWSHWQSSNHISCLQIIEYPSYGCDKWCCSVALAPASPLVLGHAHFWTAVGGKNFGTLQANLSKNWFGSHQTISVASRPLNILKICVISDVAVWPWPLPARWC